MAGSTWVAAMPVLITAVAAFTVEAVTQVAMAAVGIIANICRNLFVPWPAISSSQAISTD